MKTYHHLELTEREELSRSLVKELSYRETAKLLGRSVSTISREINRRGMNRESYRAIAAQEESQRQEQKGRKQRKLDMNVKLQRNVVQYLKKRWSPEEIAKRFKILYPNDKNMQISHETIYAYIYVHPRGHLKRELLRHLRRRHKSRRVDKKRQKSSPVQDAVSIDQRPVEVNTRKVPGHWEGDLIMGAKNHSAIGTLVERTSRYTYIVKLKNKDSETVRKAFARKFNRLPPELKQSLTYDRGQEMAGHKEFSRSTKIQVYFADPHSPWQRGTSENTNGLIRDFFPRGTNFSKISAFRLKRIQDLLNDRPRKVLNFYTPNEVFPQLVALVT